MRKVQLYIEGNRIELFNDEQIQVTSSIQNVQDISKTYTDFSQGFTVPASDQNNVFFEHWYNSDIDFSTDNNLRKDAYIEINLTTFRKGKIQLDGATLTNGKPSSYLSSNFFCFSDLSGLMPTITVRPILSLMSRSPQDCVVHPGVSAFG